MLAYVRNLISSKELAAYRAQIASSELRLQSLSLDLSRTPHLIEPMDALDEDSPDNEVAVMKSAQSAFTTLLQIVLLHSIDRDPCDMMVVQPTDSALTDFNSQKLGRAIELSPRIKDKIDNRESKAYEKK